MSAPAETVATTATPLQQLYATLEQNLSGTTLNLYPGTFSGNTPISLAIQGLPGLGTLLQMTGAQIDFPSPYDTITVTGSTGSLEGMQLTGTIVFTMQSDNVSLAASFTLAGPTLQWNGAPWFSLGAPSLSMTVAETTSGTLTGTVGIGGSTLAVTANIPLPATHQIGVDVTVSGAPLSLQSLFQFIGGIDLTASLPSGLNVLTDLALQDLDINYDYTTDTLTLFTVDLQTQPNWTVFGQLTLKTVNFHFSAANPSGTRAVSWTATSTFALGPGTIDVDLAYPPLSMTGTLDPASAPIPLSELLTFFVVSAPSIPIGGDITTFNGTFSPASGPAPTTYTVCADVKDLWQVPSSSPVFSVTDVGFQIQNTGTATSTGQVTGTVAFFENNPDITFGLTITAAYDGEEWVITGAQNEQKIKVSDILTTYLGSNWFSSALPDFDISGFSAAIHTGSDTLQQWFTLGATVEAFSPPFGDFSLTATGSFSAALSSTGTLPSGAPALPSGQLNAAASWNGIDITLGFDYAPGTQQYTLTWSDLSASVVQGTDQHWVGTLAFTDTVSLGSMVEQFVSWALGFPFGLASPWDLLNDISLTGLQLSYDFTAATVTFSVDVGPIDLIFARVTGFGLTYNTQAKPGAGRVQVTVDGSFPWLNGNDAQGQPGALTSTSNQLNWDATSPSSTATPPGNGNQYFDVRLLALGQRVAVPGMASATTVQDAIGAMAKMPVPGGTSLPLVTYSAATSWLIGTDLGLLRYDDTNYAFTVQIVFADPTLYGLRLALAGGPAKVFAGLDFQILYRKLSDTLGVYQAELTLPTAMRTIQAGIYTIQLPTFGIAVYTNGDFQVDVGFPWNNDFSRSFTVQAIIYPGIPMLGSGGFYFGKLSSATSNQVPAATNGTFNPVIIFGFGAQVGFGKSVSIGPLSAGFSLTVLGIIQGVIARWNPYDGGDPGSSSSQLDGTYYYSLSGTFGIAGTLNGSIDFAVIKASVNITLNVTAQITFTSYQPILFTVAANVDVSASLKIDLGIFSITLHFHFSLSLSESFQIGGQGTAPWTVGSGNELLSAGRLAGPLEHRLTSLRRSLQLATVNTVPVWTNLQPPATPAPLTGYLSYALTAAGDAAASLSQQIPCYVAMLVVDAPQPVTQGAPAAADTSFDTLAKLVARWTIAAFQSGPMTADQVDAINISTDDLDAIAAYLADDEDNPQPIPPSAIDVMLGGQTANPAIAPQVRLTLNGPQDVQQGTQVTGAFFPMAPELSLNVPAFGGNPALSYTFGGYNSLSQQGAANLRTYFDQLAVQVEQEQQQQGVQGRAMLSTDPNASVAGFVYADYFLFLARQMIDALSDGLRDYKYALGTGETPQQVVDWVTAYDDGYTLADVFTANAGLTLSQGVALTISGATAAAAAGDTFTIVAAKSQFGGAFDAQALATANVDNGLLLQQGATVTYGSASVQVGGGDSLTTVATRLSVPVSELLADATLLTQAGLLMPFATLSLPDYTHTTGASDTLDSVASANGVSVAALAGPAANGAVANLWAQVDGAPPQLDLPHLLSLPVSALLAEAQATGAIQQLSATVSRFHLHGLRLPTTDITPNTVGMWVTQNGSTFSLPAEAGLYALTGQQFPIPPLSTTALTITVGNASGPSWITNANGSNAVPFSVVSTDANGTQIEALRSWVTTQRLVTQYTGLGAQSQLAATPATYGLGASTPWTASSLPRMPYGAPLPGATMARLLAFPDGLSSILDHTTYATNPTFTAASQAYDQASGTTISTPLTNYGWATTLDITVQTVPAPAAGTAGAITYQVVGASSAGIVLLENLVSQFPGTGTGSLDNPNLAGVWIGYAPQPGLQAGGVQTGGSVTFGIGQANLSTVTHPQTGGFAAFVELEEDASVPANTALNGNAVFLQLLWEASITASGGFYLYYSDAGNGLPDYLFDQDGNATLTLVVVYGAGLQDQLYDCMNALAYTDPVDPSQYPVVATAVPTVPASAPSLGSTGTLGALAAAWYADLADVAHANAGATIPAGTQVAVNEGTYFVSPLGTAPGGTVAAIATWFGTSTQAIADANPRVPTAAWQSALPVNTGLRLPALTVTVGTSPGGNTLGALAAYYGADVVGLAVDNQNVAGLLSGALAITVGPVVRSSTLPAGSQLYQVQRPVATGGSDPQSQMLSWFQLLGYQVPGNQDFTLSNLGVPVGPTGGGGTGLGKTRVPTLLTEDDLWTYDVTLSYASLVAGASGTNPYQGVGRLLQTGFQWLDLYGNTIISDLSAPQSGDAGPFNLSPVLVGYTDGLVGLGQWPSANASWGVGGSAGAPQLQLAFTFDPSRYDSTTGGQDPQANAQADGPLYQALSYQLADPNGVAFTVETSLTSAPLAVTGTSLTSLTAWLGSILAYLQAVAAGQAGTVPAASLNLAFDLSNDAVNPAQIFELACSFTLARTGGVVEGEFSTVAGVASTTTTLAPTGASTAAGLSAFAAAFEGAFTGKEYTLKVAYGPDRFQGASASSATLWAVQVGTTGNPVSYAVQSGGPAIFAPAPISTSLISSSAGISPYVSGTGIDWNSSANQQFANVDLDGWVQQVFAAVDSLLAPEFISPLVILDELTDGSNLASLQAGKTSLAGIYAAQMQPVFVSDAGADPTGVQQVFTQTLLEQLGNAYTTQAALQYQTGVVAAVSEQPTPTAPPNLYGAVVQNPADTVTPGVAFTSAKLPLATQTSVPLAFLVTTPSQPGGDTAAASVTVDLWYTPSAIEHQIGTVPGIEGYNASSWLQFVNPPPVDPSQAGSLSADLGTVHIPMVLRAYPSSPAMVTQTGQATNPQATTLAQATEWTYTLQYSLPLHYPQDTVYVDVEFNLQPAQTLMLMAFQDAFPQLAQFVTVYPQVQADLTGSLAVLTESSTGEPVATASAAIGAVNQMLAKITAATESTGRLMVGRAPRALVSATGTTWSFTVVEQPQTVAGVENVLVVQVAGVTGTVPQVQIAGYTTTAYTGGNPPSGTTEYIYLDGKGNALDFTTAQSISLRSVVYPGIPILAQQNALATAYVTRNENLVTGQTTSPDFVYRTPDVTFSSTLQPTISSGTAIDISLIGSTNGKPVVRSLQAHLTALFSALTSNSSDADLTVQLVGTYTYTLNAGGGTALPITIPIFMQPPLQVTTGSDQGPVPIATMISDVANAVTAWFTSNVPSSTGGQLTFALTVMTSLTTTTMPMLSLSNLELALVDISPPLPSTAVQSSLALVEE
ncbi:MAG TPA: hypothetical protein VF006_20045 [Longimicrobium sp.]